jgi:hypothetical protein
MSTNCINCIKNKRTGPDLLCDECRSAPSAGEVPTPRCAAERQSRRKEHMTHPSWSFVIGMERNLIRCEQEVIRLHGNMREAEMQARTMGGELLVEQQSRNKYQSDYERLDTENMRLRQQLTTVLTDCDRWREDSARQSQTIQRMAKAAEDRNEVDKRRAELVAVELDEARQQLAAEQAKVAAKEAAVHEIAKAATVTAAQLSTLRKAVEELTPHVLRDYDADCASPEFKAVFERIKALNAEGGR